MENYDGRTLEVNGQWFFFGRAGNRTDVVNEQERLLFSLPVATDEVGIIRKAIKAYYADYRDTGPCDFEGCIHAIEDVTAFNEIYTGVTKAYTIIREGKQFCMVFPIPYKVITIYDEAIITLNDLHVAAYGAVAGIQDRTFKWEGK